MSNVNRRSPVMEQRLCQRGARYWRIFDARRPLRCITTIRFSSHPQSYVLNPVNKALLPNPYVIIICPVIPSRFPRAYSANGPLEYPEKQ